jgi:PAS domain S-box-containing protein
MQDALDPVEATRLEALRSRDAFGTPHETAVDRIVALAADLFDAPMAFVSPIRQDGAWPKAQFGLGGTELPWSDLFCGAFLPDALAGPRVMMDAALDPRWRDHPLVAHPPHARFYVDAPLVSTEGDVLGRLCVMDVVPRPAPTRRDLDRIVSLAALVAGEFETRRAHLASREAERLLSLAETVAGIGHWRLDIDTRELTWSDEIYRICGESRAAFRPTISGALALCHRDDRDAVASLIQRAAADGASFQFTRRIRRADGGERWVDLKGVCEFDRIGAVKALFGVLQDVTDQVATEAALRDSEARHRLLAEQETDMILHVGFDGRITYVSPSTALTTGHPAAALLGRAALDHVDPLDRRRLLREFLRLRRRSGPIRRSSLAFRAARSDGATLWLESHPTLASDAEGVPIGWVDIIRDVSGRKLQAEQMAAAAARAEAEAKARSELLADMSHELRTPLNGIIGFTQVLKRDTALGRDRLRLVERIEDAGHNLLAIVGDVLEPSRLASGRPKLASRPFSLPRLLEDAVALVQFEADRKGLDLVLDLPPVPLGLLVGDPARLRQVVLNLLSNAVKFTAFGTVRMSLSAEPEAAAVGKVWRKRGTGPPVRVSIMVEDSGVGIAAASIPKLFRRYEQADGSVAGRFGGTGLGLAISKSLIEAMNGTIEVASSPGAGSRFSVSLPLLRSEERRPMSPAARSRQGVGVDALKGRAILLAEDVALNRKLVQLMLAPLGAEVDVVVDGRAAVEAVRQRDYALVLMDMEMPILNGLEATRDIRALGGAHASLPIVALTANVFPEQLAQCRDAGMDDCLGKPFGPEELTGIALKWARGLAPAAAGPA